MRMEKWYGRERAYGIGSRFAWGRGDHGCRGFIDRTRGKFFLVVPLVEAEPGFVRVRIFDVRSLEARFSESRVDKRGIPDDLAGLAMTFKIVKGFDGEENPIHRQDKRVESQSMEPFTHWSANLAIKFRVAYPSDIKEWLKIGRSVYKNLAATQYIMAASPALTGMVRTQAQRRLMVTPQRTADIRFVLPAPIMA